MKEIIDQINSLRQKHQAVILAHNYVSAEVQDIADFVGDSLELSIKAQTLQAKVIVFCGVSFMAETAKILSPQSIVLHPEPLAGCPMADMVEVETLKKYRQDNPDTVLVAYVNTTAAVKTMVDICCTSANAEKVIRSIDPDKKILFLPDQNLGANVSTLTGRQLELYPGFCPTHNRVLPEVIIQAKQQHPEAIVLIHPECTPSAVAEADFALSTGGMLKKVRSSDASTFIIVTEQGILHRMRRENPDKTFYHIEPNMTCPNMKKISLENVLDSLSNFAGEVKLDAQTIESARRPIERMLKL